MTVIHWVIVLLVLPLSFLPTIIAIRKNHPHKIAIILVNIFGGLLYGLGWIAAMIWCFILPKKETGISPSTASELERLHQLKEKGVLTQEEFDTRKRAILEN
jgi:hypothetical protein